MRVSPLCRAMAGPTSPSRTNGGIGAKPMNAWSMTSTGVPPSWTRPTSPMNRPSSRLTMNDGESLTRMQVFFSFAPTANAVARVAGSVLEPGMISSNGMTATGLKKWKPTTRSGWARSLAISVIDRLDVFVASTQVSETTASHSAKTCFLTPISSKTASMTNSASAKPSLLVEPLTRALKRLSLSGFSRPFLASPSSWPWT
jgi:hypothetical protein